MIAIRLLILTIAAWAAVLALPARALTIISPVVEVTVDPGTTRQGAVKVYNETDRPLSLVSAIEAISGFSNDGTVEYSDAEPAYLSWITVEQDVMTLGPRQAALVPFTVTVPRNAPPGGHYAAIFWQEELPPGERQVGVQGRVGTIVFITVTGSITEAGTIDRFELVPASGLQWSAPLTFSLYFKNDGNIHLQPRGVIELTNWFGHKRSVPVNVEARAVLPGQTRRFDVIWPGSVAGGSWWQRWWDQLAFEARYAVIGPYHASLSVTYGASAPQSATSETSFTVIPLRMIGATIGLAVLLVLIWKINRRISKLKRAASRS